ncbi:MAG TPA: CHAT domain-containing protein [Kofleriaceae bacterium]|nr:CHAT domain-containing protein [Kofleriaceae bacterium]
MRGVLVVVGILLAASPAAGQPKKPPAPDRDAQALARLEKELLDHQVKGGFVPALRTARKIHALKLKKHGPDHPDTIRALQDVARFMSSTGDFLGSLRLHQQMLASAEKKHGKEHRETLTALEGLASQYWVAQRYDEADKLYQRILALHKKLDGPESALYATYLQIYGGLLWGRGSLSSAEQYYLEAKKIQDKVSGPDDVQSAGLLMSLGHIYWAQGERTKARRHFDRCLVVYEKFYRETMKDPEQAAAMILAVAQIYSMGGEPGWARPLEERGEKLYRAQMAKIEKESGPTDVRLIAPITTLANLHMNRKEWDQAEKLFRRLMAIDAAQRAAQKTPASALGSIGWMYQMAYLERRRGRPEKALPVFAKVRDIYQKSYGSYMADLMDQQIADTWREMGRYKDSRKLLERLVKSTRKTWGPRHPTLSYQLESLSLLNLAEGKTRPALDLMRDALDIQEPNLALVLATGTESDHVAYFGRVAHQLSMAISLNARYAPRDPAAAQLAMTTVLRRKGRILDAAASTVAALRGQLSADDQKLLDELTAARAQLAKLILAGPKATGKPDEYAAEVGRLETEVKRLEDQVRRKSAAYRATSQPIELARVQKMIPADAALVEIVVYQPFDARKWGMNVKLEPRRYASYLVGRTGAPRWIDLGEAEGIDKAADRFLEALADPDSADVDKLGRALYDRTLRPVVAQLGQSKTTKLLVAPDGLLNLVPLGAMVDETGKHLVRRFTFTYLTSGRDLLRIGAGAKPKSSPLIVADPTFDDEAGQTGGTRGRRSRDFRSMKWSRLPGTAEEADALARLLTDARVLRGSRATEASLKKASGPRVLHIATHGFFLPAAPPPKAEIASELTAAGPPTTVFATPTAVDSSGPENPLLRSGLALAGANKLSSGGEDGILTALEAAGIDLWGTQLVVLSACETGVGKVTEGDGVHGLRRALVIAGAETLVMSLWQVDDKATRELMTGYYERLGQGEGRSEALRQVQLKMLRSERRSHPYYWASFVPTGNWAPLAQGGKK